VTERSLNPGEQALMDRLNPLHRPPMKRFVIEQEAIIDRLRAERERIKTGKIHHYVKNEVGLRGICAGHLWMSDYTTLNDSVEIKHGVDTGLKVLKQECEALPRSERLRVFISAVNGKVRRGLSHYFSAYVSSLSLDGRNPVLWERYADHGTGYSLEFESAILDQAFLVFTKSNGLEASGSFEVIYDDDRLRSIMQEYVHNAIETVAAIVDPPALRRRAEQALNEIASNLLFAFIFTALYFKDTSKDWQEEREYRYLIMTLPDKRIPGLLFRDAGGQSIGYYPFDWKTGQPQALTSIAAGAANGEAEGKLIIGEVLAASGLSAEIRRITALKTNLYRSPQASRSPRSGRARECISWRAGTTGPE
jgi:Protein of unknown function (DUF2971)